ncbi:AraC family transcriptional regulator [Spirochaeta cellobiosiphila]|uniref:AraC family transcriptional regulator n=1 Tax=Spirochaeta cellobiosiphila TaxID=504483 RepID=UPI000411B547|nr:AraC family transcriptional regulator [Spirochaeta cellobiosiphila]
MKVKPNKTIDFPVFFIYFKTMENVLPLNIGLTHNPYYPDVELKWGRDQYSRHTHIHQTWSLSYVLHGSTRVSIGTFEGELKSNQFVAIPSGIPHLCSPDENNPFSFVVLYLPIEYLDEQIGDWTNPRIGRMDSATLFDFIDPFILLKTKKEIRNHTKRLKLLLYNSSSPLDSKWGENLLHRGRDPHIKPAKLSRFQRYRFTRKLFGIGHKKLDTIEKMEQAKKLLNDGQDLVDVALICGFYDQSHFTKVFKAYTGLTPSQYLKR